MLRVMNDYHDRINYWIYTDAEGNIDVYKKQQRSKKHLQHLLLPLDELWKKSPKKVKKETKEDKSSDGKYPILFGSNYQDSKYFSTADGEVFILSAENALFRRFDKNAKANEIGWELIIENLPFKPDDAEIGLSLFKEHLLLMFQRQSKKGVIINLSTLESVDFVIPEWKSTPWSSFTYCNDRYFFYYLDDSNSSSWLINRTGDVGKVKYIHFALFIDREKELKEISQKHQSFLNIFKNIKTVFINDNGQLVFNKHVLRLTDHNHIKLEATTSLLTFYKANQINDNEFEFADGSRIEVNRNGLLILRSSSENVPTVYIPSVLDASLGVATEKSFAGNPFYNNHNENSNIMNQRAFFNGFIVGFIRIIHSYEGELTQPVKPFAIVETQPEFPGGQNEMFKFLMNTVVYPNIAKRQGISGTVYVGFVINTEGVVTNVEVKKGIHDSLDDEAVRVVKMMPIWIPGRQQGRAVRVAYTLPIKFKLE